jgi:hypothetical protein
MSAAKHHSLLISSRFHFSKKARRFNSTMLLPRRGGLLLLYSKGCNQTILSPLCSAFTTQPKHNNPNDKPPSSDFNNTLLNSLLQKNIHDDTNHSSGDVDKVSASNSATHAPTQPKHQGLKDLAMGIPIFFGLWVVTCGSVYTAVKTNSLDTQTLFGMDRSYAVEKIVSSMEWYTGMRPTVEQIENKDINDALLALSITKLTSPFRLIMTMMLMNRPSAADSLASPK